MKRHYLLFLTMILLLLVMVGCSSNEPNKPNEAKSEVSEKKVELTISAAVSLKDALYEIHANFEKEHSNIKVNYNFGASGALGQQISQGAPVDLFFCC